MVYIPASYCVGMLFVCTGGITCYKERHTRTWTLQYGLEKKQPLLSLETLHILVLRPFRARYML